MKLSDLWLSIIRGKFSPFPWSAEVQNRQSSLASWWDWNRSVLFQVHCYAEGWLFDMSALWAKISYWPFLSGDCAEAMSGNWAQSQVKLRKRESWLKPKLSALKIILLSILKWENWLLFLPNVLTNCVCVSCSVVSDSFRPLGL